MTQSRDDDVTSRKDQHNQQDEDDSRSPEHEATSPATDLAGDEEAAADETGEEGSSTEDVEEVEDVDGGSVSQHPEGDAVERDSADTADADDIGDSDTPISGSTVPTASSARRRAGSRRRRRTVGQSIARGVGILTSVALAGAVGGVTWWGHAAPTTWTSQLEALSLAQPGAATTYVCPKAPTNTLRGTDVGAVESTTTIIPANGAESIQSAAYADSAVSTDATTSLRHPHSRPRRRPGGQRRRIGDHSDAERRPEGAHRRSLRPAVGHVLDRGRLHRGRIVGRAATDEPRRHFGHRESEPVRIRRSPQLAQQRRGHHPRGRLGLPGPGGEQ